MEEILRKSIRQFISMISENNISVDLILEWASPVPVFGNPSLSKVATLGINPSDREFLDQNGLELDSKLQRFPTLSSLRLENWDAIDDRAISKIKNSCYNYFISNPYDAWFKPLDLIVSGTGHSYYSSFFSACHLDLVPFATKTKWSKLSKPDRESLINATSDDFSNIVKNSPIEVIILNGSTVVNNFREVSGTEFTEQIQPSWNLFRGNSQPILGKSYEGEVSRIGRIDLGKCVQVLGFNHNIQSSFGVTNKVKHSIRDWISRQTKEI